MIPPKVFISYSHDSPEHKTWVRKLATDLRSNGVDALLDQWDLALGQDVTTFMQNGILSAERVFLVCSESYVTKAEAGIGGVGFERLIVTAEILQSIDTKKFIPLVRENAGVNKVPRFLGPRLYIDFSDDASYSKKLEDLLRELLGARATPKPALGVNPFASEARMIAEPMRVTGPTGIKASGSSVLSDQWFKTEHESAVKGLRELGLVSYMEFRFGLQDAVNKSQIELLNAIRKSEIYVRQAGILTYGWTPGVTLTNRDKFQPRPYGDGIRAVASSIPGKSYDYWTARSTGDILILQDLVKGMDGGGYPFNTRIICVTETLLFALRLYTNLGVRPDALVSIRMAHRGLAGKNLTRLSHYNGDYNFNPKITLENTSESETVVELGNIRERLVDKVRRILEPLSRHFGFHEFETQIYEDIVNCFEQEHGW